MVASDDGNVYNYLLSKQLKLYDICEIVKSVLAVVVPSSTPGQTCPQMQLMASADRFLGNTVS